MVCPVCCPIGDVEEEPPCRLPFTNLAECQTADVKTVMSCHLWGVPVMDAHMMIISCDLYRLHHVTMAIGLDWACVNHEPRVRVSYSADMLEHVCYLILFISLTNPINNMHIPSCILTHADSFPHVS